MFEVFTLRLAAGMAWALLVLPRGAVPGRFYRIQLLIVLCLAAAAAALGWNRESDAFWIPLGLGMGAALAGTWCWALAGAPGGKAALFVTGASLLAAAIDAQLSPSVAPATILQGAVDAAASGALLGAATSAMLMGHWYLISPTLSIQPLLRLLLALFAALGFRILICGVELTAGLAASPELGRVAWLWLTVRWGAGIAGALFLAVMAWKTARIRSTQSATGILYVATIFVFFGELTGLLLQASWGPPENLLR